MLAFAAVCPHPPLLIPSIGGEDALKVQSTMDAMQQLAKMAAVKKIDTLLVISPHGPVFMDFMSLNLAEKLTGDFSDFGSDIELEFINDLELAESIQALCRDKKFPLQTVSESLDHGAMVPLYYLTQDLPNAKVCHISFSYLSYSKHLNFGKILFEAIQNSDKNIALIASGDLSHRLTPEAPAGYSPQGKVFDELLIENLESHNADNILNMDTTIIEDAGECGLRSIIILLGALSNVEYKFKRLSYEGPFGVGYLVGKFDL